MSTEAMKLALDALEWCHGGEPCGTAEAITALREALAEQPAQQDYERGFIDGMQKQMQSSVDRAVNAMSQRTWVDLTDDEVVHLKMLGRDLEFVSMTALRRFARDIAQTLKEKNT